MKKVIIIAGIFSVILSSCSTSKLATNNDDVYSNPTEDRLEKARLVAAQKKHDQEEAKKQADQRAAELAAQKAKDDANPAYKDPSYNKDDYYDYQYASRIRRFNNPVCGVGYYDNYYTNSYMYNGNPAMYGTSIYNSYNYWGNSSYGYGGGFPSSYFGMSYGMGYPNYGYNNFGYSNYGYGCSPYYGGYGYNSYGMGYAQGYNNGFYNGYYGYPYGGYGYGNYGGYNNGWGYYNSYDVNSNYSHPTNGPRGSHDGGNTGHRTNPSNYNDGLSQKFIQEVQVAQVNTPKFNEELRNIKATKASENFNNSSTTNFDNSNFNGIRPNEYNSNPKNNINSGNNNDANFNNNHSGNYNQPKNNINSSNTNDAQFNNNTPPKTNTYNPTYETDKPVRNNNINSNPKGNLFDSGSPTFNSGGNNFPSGGNSSPRGGSSSGGGGGHRPH